jgi:cytochrome P450
MNEQFQPPKGTPLFNPWTPEFIADPYPFYHRLRVTDPMHLTPLGLYIASRHSDVTEILRDKRFGKDFIGRMTRRSGPTRQPVSLGPSRALNMLKLLDLIIGNVTELSWTVVPRLLKR